MNTLAAQFLQVHEFTQVSPMRGGILLWMQKGYPVIGQRCNPGQAQQSLPLPLS